MSDLNVKYWRFTENDLINTATTGMQMTIDTMVREGYILQEHADDFIETHTIQFVDQSLPRWRRILDRIFRGVSEKDRTTSDFLLMTVVPCSEGIIKK